jgi:cephalosporin hydroxylase
MNFQDEVDERIQSYEENAELQNSASSFLYKSVINKYSYNFSSLGRPIIQYPQDMVAMQELIWDIKPDLIIETGIAHGGSLIMNASMLALLDYCDAIKLGEVLDPNKPRRRVLGIDIEIREHNRIAINEHPMSNRIDMIEGSSIDSDIIEKVKEMSSKFNNVLVCLDSNHTHEHVLAELEGYAPLTTTGSYCVVFDTLIEEMPDGAYPDRSWGVGDNPKTAVKEYLKEHPEFKIDKSIDNKLLVSVASDGYLKKIS